MDMDGIYLKATETVPDDEIDKETCAADIITEVENGESKIVACSRALKGLNAWSAISELYDEIKAEKAALTAIHFCEYTTLTTFKEALEAVSVYISVDQWLLKLNLKYGFKTWSEAISWCQLNYGQEIE